MFMLIFKKKIKSKSKSYFSVLSTNQYLVTCKAYIFNFSIKNQILQITLFQRVFI